MKKRFPHRNDNSVLIAQDDRFDFHLHVPFEEPPFLVARNASPLTFRVRFDVPDKDDLVFGPAVTALYKTGLRR